MKLLDLDENQRDIALEFFNEALDAYDKLVTHEDLTEQVKMAVGLLLISTMAGPFIRNNGEKFFEALRLQVELLYKREEEEDVVKIH